MALIEAVHRFMENTAEFFRSEEQKREGRRKETAYEWVKRAEVGGPYSGWNGLVCLVFSQLCLLQLGLHYDWFELLSPW